MNRLEWQAISDGVLKATAPIRSILAIKNIANYASQICERGLKHWKFQFQAFAAVAQYSEASPSGRVLKRL